MKNDEIKYYQFIGSKEDAEGYENNIPVRNKVYSGTEKIGCGTVAYWAFKGPVNEIHEEWKLVNKPNKAI